MLLLIQLILYRRHRRRIPCAVRKPLRKPSGNSIPSEASVFLEYILLHNLPEYYEKSVPQSHCEIQLHMIGLLFSIFK